MRKLQSRRPVPVLLPKHHYAHMLLKPKSPSRWWLLPFRLQMSVPIGSRLNLQKLSARRNLPAPPLHTTKRLNGSLTRIQWNWVPMPKISYNVTWWSTCTIRRHNLDHGCRAILRSREKLNFAFGHNLFPCFRKSTNSFLGFDGSVPFQNASGRECSAPNSTKLQPLSYVRFVSSHLGGSWWPVSLLLNFIFINRHSFTADGQNLSGTLPVEVIHFPRLQSISFDWNQFRGTLPPQWAQIKDIINIEVHYNFLTGTVPNSWWNIKNLLRLTIGGNMLTGTIPSQVSGLGSIKGLFTFNNLLTGPLPSELGKLKNLSKIHVLCMSYIALLLLVDVFFKTSHPMVLPSGVILLLKLTLVIPPMVFKALFQPSSVIWSIWKSFGSTKIILREPFLLNLVNWITLPICAPTTMPYRVVSRTSFTRWPCWIEWNWKITSWPVLLVHGLKIFTICPCGTWATTMVCRGPFPHNLERCTIFKRWKCKGTSSTDRFQRLSAISFCHFWRRTAPPPMMVLENQKYIATRMLHGLLWSCHRCLHL